MGSYLERYQAGMATLGLVTVLITPEPDTRCEVCWRAEQDPFMRGLRTLFGRSHPVSAFAGISGVMSAALGRPVPTWYDRHREEWEQTGDRKHLARMLRHVSTPGGM